MKRKNAAYSIFVAVRRRRRRKKRRKNKKKKKKVCLYILNIIYVMIDYSVLATSIVSVYRY